ncbi:eukaryotic rRNA processing protein EBP2-domain-containing protein [Hygrophoropsis aurantiaca]|uniref:Eukaryotic rRNA processing protein EBP2-domain-containing protein n=1 Tax=Hygrophoropsis aurantiaca TaxID=72124 RepID=A0ACB8A473_9AGAM|nr:eukaryotic rRNA processing protein EBP2-domain-containing protein [Hygrophoropsis aurantiaca]
MEKLIKLLGEDGLNPFDQNQLQSLMEVGNNDDESDSDESQDEQAEDAEEGEQSSSEEVLLDQESEGENNSDEDDEDNIDEGSSDEEGNVALDDLEDRFVDEDVVPKQKVEIDNTIALERIRQTIQLDRSLPWTETLAVVYSQTIEADVDDDLNRELAFYKQALDGANAARALAAKHNFPFTRPADYFAEMVKSDSHMERIRQRLLDENAGMKKSEEKRKEREGKKFGKQVQLEKLKEREKSKKDMDERLKNLKRKRKGGLDNAEADGDAFDVAIEDAISDNPAKRGRGAGGKKITRNARDQKFGFGGKGRHSKQNTKASTDDFGPKSGRGGRGGMRGGMSSGRGGRRGSSGHRPGKSKRMASRSKG